jgi:anthranilate/para-aminobenzoate synthase component II
MKKILIFIVVLLTNISVLFADAIDDYVIEMLDSLATLQKNVPNFTQQDYIDFMNDMVYVASNMSGGYTIPNDIDIQFGTFYRTEGKLPIL